MSMQQLLQLAQTFTDETRLRLLTLLLEGDATVSDMVTRLGLPQPRVSTHLAQLRQAGVVSVAMAGRQRVYRVDAVRVKTVLDALQALAPTTPRRSPQATREVQRNTAMRHARTCYDHLAGVVGVQLLEDMLSRAWLEPDESQEHTRRLYHLTPHGRQALSERDVDIARAQKARRHFAFGCLDWTERRAHLGGALGAAILKALVTAGIMRPQSQTRTVVPLQPVMDWLDATSSGGAADARESMEHM
jgi:DNA-binding transcriptional ArsR family regulator